MGLTAAIGSHGRQCVESLERRMPGFDNYFSIAHENARDVANWLIFHFVLAALNVYNRAIGNLSSRRFKVAETLLLLLYPQARSH